MFTPKIGGNSWSNFEPAEWQEVKLQPEAEGWTNRCPGCRMDFAILNSLFISRFFHRLHLSSQLVKEKKIHQRNGLQLFSLEDGNEKTTMWVYMPIRQGLLFWKKVAGTPSLATFENARWQWRNYARLRWRCRYHQWVGDAGDPQFDADHVALLRLQLCSGWKRMHLPNLSIQNIIDKAKRKRERNVLDNLPSIPNNWKCSTSSSSSSSSSSS